MRLNLITGTILLLLAACIITWGDVASGSITVGPVTLVSGPSPFEQGCDGGPSLGFTNYHNYEVEPYVAVNPIDPLNIVVSFQEDRWLYGGANAVVASVTHDGGATWMQVAIPGISNCSGGYMQRTGDSWLTFSPDGDLYNSAISFNTDMSGTRIFVSKSTDGGDTWGDPVVIHADSTPNALLDKDSITADPFDSNYVYASWYKTTFGSGTQPTVNARHSYAVKGPTWFARSTDGGKTWEPGRMIFDPGEHSYSKGNQIVVLPNGDLVNAFMLTSEISNAQGIRGRNIAIIRSGDKGLTWSGPTIIAKMDIAYPDDLKTGEMVFSETEFLNIAVDKRNGSLYIVWEDGRFSNGLFDAIAFVKSTDGGMTWSAPVQVNKAVNVSAFLPSVAVADDGAIAVTYYDYRNDTLDPSVLMTDYWIVVSRDGGETWEEAHVGGPFDMRSAPAPGAWWYFLGDYVSLTNAGNSFVAAFPMANSGDLLNPTDIFVSIIAP